jgi:glutathione S-transferase
MRLLYSETLNPRKACAVAKYLAAPVEYVRVDLGKGENRTQEFLGINPNGKVPVLEDGDIRLWEANAIMCHLSHVADSDLWPRDERQIEVMRWLSWNSDHFTRHAGTLYFQYLIKPFLGMGEPDTAVVAEAQKWVRQYGSILNDHLRGRKYLVADSLSVADFAVGVTLPYAEGRRSRCSNFPRSCAGTHGSTNCRRGAIRFRTFTPKPPNLLIAGLPGLNLETTKGA